MSLTITQRPTQNGIYAKNTVPKIILSTSVDITAQLAVYGHQPIFTGSYAPDFSNHVTLDFKSLYEGIATTDEPTGQSNVIEQSGYKAMLQLTLTDSNNNTETLLFWVCNAQLKSSTAFETWAQANFLTNQPLEKRTNKEAVEWLTYMDTEKNGNRVLKARFYPKAGGNADVTVYTDTIEGVYSVNVSYKRIIEMVNALPSQLLGYYDLILYDGSGNEICRQRYIYDERSGREHYYCFVNALGGIDTLVCVGENVLQPEATHNVGRFADRYKALNDSNDRREWQQATGMLPNKQRDWLHELTTVKQWAAKYDATGETYTEIVMTASDISVSDFGQLATASFNYILTGTDNVISDTERATDRSLHKSVAEAAQAFDDLSTTVVLQLEPDGNDGYETEEVTLAATKLYVAFDDSITAARTVPVYYYLDGSNTAAGSFTPGTDASPVIITKLATDSIRFASQSGALGSLSVSYYPVTIQSV